MVIEGVRGSGIEGDIAIDDVAIEEGECKDPPPNSEYALDEKLLFDSWLLQAHKDAQSLRTILFKLTFISLTQNEKCGHRHLQQVSSK